MKRHSNFLDTLIDIIADIEAMKIHTGLMKRIYNILRKSMYGQVLLTIL